MAAAEFDAVVSGDIYVLAPKADRLLPALLPFLCLSERFFQHAVGTSAGSLSPRTNWTSLATFEVALPPIDSQRRIAEILWASDEAAETSVANLRVLASLKKAAMEEYTLFGKPLKGNKAAVPDHPMRPLGEVATCQYGLNCPLSATGAYPVLRMMNYDEELVTATDLKYADMPPEVASEFELKKGDILFNRTNSADLVGKVGIFALDARYLFASYLVRVQTNRSVLSPEFLNYYLNSPHGQAALRAFATPGVSQSNISAGSLKKVLVPVPPVRQQEAIVEKLTEITSAYRARRTNLAALRGMLQTVINAILGDQQ